MTKRRTLGSDFTLPGAHPGLVQTSQPPFPAHTLQCGLSRSTNGQSHQELRTALSHTLPQISSVVNTNRSGK
jgi:hypothetical protein